MSLHQASLRLRHECPYRELSERFPDVTIREWYLSDCQVLEISSRRPSPEDLLGEIERLGSILHRSVDESGVHVVTQACLCSLENSIVKRFEEHNCLYQPPTVHRHGWEQYQLIAFDEEDITALYNELNADREIKLLSKTGLAETQLPHSMLAPVDRLFDGLTDRQIAALRIALENGYYEQPRSCTISELAERTTVARATFEEHLRKAENKLVKNAGQFVHLLSETRPDDGLREGPDSPVAGRA